MVLFFTSLDDHHVPASGSWCTWTILNGCHSGFYGLWISHYNNCLSYLNLFFHLFLLLSFILCMIIHVLSAMDVWTQPLIAIFGRVSPDIFPFSSTRVRQQWWLAIPEAKGWFLSWTKGKHHLYIIVSSRTTAAEKKHAVYLAMFSTLGCQLGPRNP